MSIDVEAAKKELLEKTKEQIESETADRWASLALAAYALAEEEPDEVRWLVLASDYEHEATEHAAQVGVEKLEDVLGEIRSGSKKWSKKTKAEKLRAWAGG